MNSAGYVGKRVLVTGGTGSFGHTVAAQLLGRDVANVVGSRKRAYDQEGCRRRCHEHSDLLTHLRNLSAEEGRDS